MASFLPVEVKFAQSLADNEKKNRFRAVKKLKKYLQARSSSSKDGFTKDDFLKIWKGLHYCLWMQDQPLIQEELSVTLAQMVHELGSVEAKMLFIKVFFITEAREWSAIDVWRIDKFMMLVRSMLHESLIMVRKLHWKPEPLDRLMTIYTDVVMSPTSDAIPEGLKIHFTDIYLEEIEKVGGEQLTSIQLIKLLDPFVTYLKLGKNPLVHRRIMSRVFEPILARAMELVRRKTSRGNEEPSESEVPFMSMQFNNNMMADHLFQQGMGQGVSNKNRTALYDLVKRLRDAEQGTLPRQKEISNLPGVSYLDMKKAVTSLVTMETEDAKEKTKKKKKKHSKKNENTDPNNNAGADTDGIQSVSIETAIVSSSKKGKRKNTEEESPEAPLTKIKKKNTEDDTDGKSTGMFRGVLKNKLKKGSPKNKSPLKREIIAETTPLPRSAIARETSPSVYEVTTPIKYKKVDKGSEKVTLVSVKKGSDVNTEPPQSFKITGKAENMQWVTKEQTQPIKFRDSTLNKTPGSSKKRKAPEPVETRPEPVETCPNDIYVSGIYKHTNVSVPQIVIETETPKSKRNSPKSKKSHSPSPNSQASLGSNFARFDGSTAPVAYVRRSFLKVNTPHSQPGSTKSLPGSAKSQRGSSKRVSFDMKKNKAQGFTESLNSPLTPYNPTKKPDQGILKSPNTADPSTPVSSLMFGKATPPTPRSQNAIARVKNKRRASTSQGQIPSAQTPSATFIIRRATPQARTPIAALGPTLMKKRNQAVDFFYM